MLIPPDPHPPRGSAPTLGARCVTGEGGAGKAITQTPLAALEASALAHTVHYGLVVVGLVGLASLLLPPALASGAGRPVRTEHEGRVEALRRRANAGDLATLAPVASRAPAATALDPVRTLWLPLALVGSTAAAGVHAAIAPAHLGPLPAFGLFFLACATAQLTWSAWVLLAPSSRVLVAGVVGNGALLLLWAASRTVGLPGVLPRAEPVGAWDLVCAAWEVLAVVACLVALRRAPSVAVAPPLLWHRAATATAAASVVVLALVPLSGAGA